MIGQIVSVTRTGAYVTASVRVNEGAGRGNVEYVATVRATDPQNVPYANSEIKAALIAAWQAQRAAGQPAPVDLSAFISGNVNL